MGPPVTVGARELKARLGTYLRRVRDGRRIVVTERGTPVAELRSLREGDDGLDARLLRLESSGLVTRPTRRSVPRRRLIRGRGSPLSRAIAEEREDRF